MQPRWPSSGALSVAISLGEQRDRAARWRLPKARCSAATPMSRSAPRRPRCGTDQRDHCDPLRRGPGRPMSPQRPRSSPGRCVTVRELGQYRQRTCSIRSRSPSRCATWSAAAKIAIDVLDEKALSPWRLRRPDGGRWRIVPAATAGAAELQPARRQVPSRTGRQGHHLRHGWSQPQAAPKACTR